MHKYYYRDEISGKALSHQKDSETLTRGDRFFSKLCSFHLSLFFFVWIIWSFFLSNETSQQGLYHHYLNRNSSRASFNNLGAILWEYLMKTKTIEHSIFDGEFNFDYIINNIDFYAFLILNHWILKHIIQSLEKKNLKYLWICE